MGHGHADGDGIPRRGVGADSGDFAVDRDRFLQQPADAAIAEAREVTEFPPAMQDLDGTRIVRVVRLCPQGQSGAGLEFGERLFAVVVPEAGDGERGWGEVE